MDSDEDKLLKDFQNGNPKAFETLFHRYKDRMYNFAYKMLGNEDSAGDVTQEVFIKLFRSRNNTNQINNLKNYLFVSTRNICLNKIRDQKSQIGLEDIEDLPGKNESLEPQNLKIQRALAELEPGLKEALILREYQGFSYKEISEILGLSGSAVKSLLFRARARLKEIFEKIN